MNTPQHLAHYVQPNLPEARIAHQWAKIADYSYRQNKYRTRLVPAFALALFVCCVVAVGWKWMRMASPSTLSGTVVESGTAGTQSLTLPDGSQVELSPSSRLVIDEYSGARVQLTLQKGRVAFEVTHQSRRPFNIDAAGLDITVIGTRFSVSLVPDSQQVTVQVDKGKVKVRNRLSPPDDRVLAAGQSWTSSVVVGPTLGAPTSVDASAQSDEPTSNIAAPEMSSNSELAPSGVNRAAAGTSLTAGVAKSSSESSKELFELAEMARINGKLRDSADALNKLRRTYRSDPRAGLAAFELGRMRMDIFGDVSGSIDALRDAIHLSPGASFREDAESRLVQLYNRQGNFVACQAAKSEYLNHFPRGAANKVVSRLCEH